MRKLFLFLTVAFIGVTKLHADPYNLDKSGKALEDMFSEMRYTVVQGSIATPTALTQSVTFYGFGTGLTVQVVSSNAITYTGSWTNDARTGKSTGTIAGTTPYYDNFYKPVSSPTIFTPSLPGGSTIFYSLKGLKKD